MVATGKPIFAAVAASLALLGVYFGALGLLSGWDSTVEQFLGYRYFVLALAAGFGIQVGLFVYLKRLVQGARSQGMVLATSGTASTAAMVSCCTHYLANVAPITHSGSLDDNLANAAVMVDAAGKQYRPVAWQGDASGGHHRKGVLKFKALSPRPDAIELRIQRAGEAAARSFRWQLK